ncbi:MAG TPA: hypothetical protein VGH28_24610 [Polyangiaceae bacterium]|jgi:hypothetical protein
MHKFIACVLAASTLFAVACSQHDLSPIKGPDGQEWVAISCKDSARECWRAAGDFCPGGWETADEVQSRTHGFLIFGHHVRNEMLVRCKAPGPEVARAASPSAQ